MNSEQQRWERGSVSTGARLQTGNTHLSRPIPVPGIAVIGGDRLVEEKVGIRSGGGGGLQT